jgi:hypothetical protein
MMTKASKNKVEKIQENTKKVRKLLDYAFRKWKKMFQWNTKTHIFRLLPKGGTKLKGSFGGKI